MKSESLRSRIDNLVRERRLYLDSDLKIHRIARDVCSNRTYVSEMFRYYGESFREYVNSCRADHALSLMRESIASGRIMDVTEIAISSGFRNERTMNKYLSDKFGKTASKIMRDFKNDYLCENFERDGRREDHFFYERSGKDTFAQQ